MKSENDPLSPYNKIPPRYYVPHHAYWPIVGSFGLFITVIGGVNILHKNPHGWLIFAIGLLLIVSMMFGWFKNVIEESLQGLNSPLMDRSYRMGMVWFIFSEVMFFAAFFGALWYTRDYTLPWLSGESSDKLSTHTVLWQHFKGVWPLLENPNPEKFKGPKEAMSAWGIPSINTLILLTSGLTVTIAHYALKADKRKKLNIFLLATILLGAIFLSFQAYEYHHAYSEMGLTLNSGIYGSTFFMLTGFHGAHVTVGTIMLFIILLRCLKGHFTPANHFGFEAVAWYWHFVDVVWLLLFIFVYWL